MKLDAKLTCPYCDKTLDGMLACSGEQAKPKVGDYSICLYCHGYLEYQGTHHAKLSLKDVKEPEIKEELKCARRLIKMYGQINPIKSNPTA
jgi:predicted transcriptional regulator